jgi:hypothetical protein
MLALALVSPKGSTDLFGVLSVGFACASNCACRKVRLLSVAGPKVATGAEQDFPRTLVKAAGRHHMSLIGGVARGPVIGGSTCFSAYRRRSLAQRTTEITQILSVAR